MSKRTLPDLFDSCFEGEHRKLSPEQFQETWCKKCLNAGCRNSRGSELKWVQRMLEQEDVLLDNPRYADLRDPRLQPVAEQNFQDMLHHALVIEVSSRKGDWSIPTEAEVGVAAAELVGLVPPTGFKKPSEPEPTPPDRLVDEVQKYDFQGEPETLGGVETLEGLASLLGDEPPGPLAVPEPSPERWRVRGDSGAIYEVQRHPDGTWECSCPSRENPCKHARDIALKLTRSAPEQEAPAHPTRPPPDPQAPRPKQTNTSQQDGSMIGGGRLTPTPPAPDPWAPPEAAPKERVIPVGGRVSFGSGKKG